MKAWFLDVGQGAAALLEFPCGAILIDTGGDSEARVASLVTQLEWFFKRRADLARTLDSVIISHPHVDHTRGLRRVVETFTVKRYLDNGHTGTSDPGGKNVRWIRKEIALKKIPVALRAIDDTALAGKPAGLTDDHIDPLSCSTCDPVITVLSGGHKQETPSGPHWSRTALENKNNHSLVVRVDFGKSSFLFTGDLEDAGVAHLVDRYRGTPLLDVDVYIVGHHGAENATTKDFLKEITPKIAIMGTGKWDDGKTPYKTFSTYAYGHPRGVVVDLLAQAITDERSPRVKRKVAAGVRDFRDATITQRIYATGWDGTILITADTLGAYTVATQRVQP